MLPVKILGRHIIFDEIIWLSSSGSEVSFVFELCGSGEIVLHGDETATAPERVTNRARYAVYFDDVLIALGVMDTAEKHIPVPMGIDSHGTVRIVKLSEASQSNLGVSLHGFDGVVAPLPDKKRKIEFIGDSITCGYAIDGNVSLVYTTAIEDAGKTYAAYVAGALDADACYTAFSGFGIVSGYTGDGVRNTQILVPDWYEKVGYCDAPVPGHDRVNAYDWDFSRFVPDTVVINLGTNDFSYTGADEEKQNFYRDEYVKFLKTVRRRNPDARIVCMLGMMGEILNEKAGEAVEMYRAETGDTRVSFHPFTLQRPEDGLVPDGHPTPLTNRKAGEKLLAILNRAEQQKNGS
ncbi:MAG: GDSL family lipase [Clostridiales bacterium]|nr:GDSL family lipase [Clostridiales bacterium]